MRALIPSAVECDIEETEVRKGLEPRGAGLLGRETRGEVVLASRLGAAQSAWPSPQPGLSATLLPLGEGPGDKGAQLALPPEAITAAVDELTCDRLTLQRLAGQAALPHPASPILRTLTSASPKGRGGGRGA